MLKSQLMPKFFPCHSNFSTMVMKFPGKLPPSTIPLFAQEEVLLVHIIPLTLIMKSLIVKLKEETTFSTVLTPMETDGTKDL